MQKNKLLDTANDKQTECPDPVDSFFVNEFQREIWNDNYRDNGETINETLMRQVRAIYAEEDPGLAEMVYYAMANRRLFFGGRTTANIGTALKNVYAFNCYAAQRSVKPVDSIECIYKDLANAAHILKTEGGIGFNFNHLRPRGTLIKGVGVGTPGAVSFMDLYNESADGITKGNPGSIKQAREEDATKEKIRKGAQMAMLDCRHPDTIEFIEAKKVPNRLDRFNMSVIITDSFMEALEAGGEHEFWFPDVHDEHYDEEWMGDFDVWEEKGYGKVSYGKMPAQELWDLIILNMYNRNEPGLYFIDNANRYNNLIYYQKVTGTNPCGEINMLADAGVWVDPKTGIVYKHLGDICNLGALNLAAYHTYKPGDEFKSDRKWHFDFDLFAQDTELLVRGLDNLIDISGYPLEELKTAAKLRRKIGAGFMGYGSLLVMLGIRYGSKEAMEFTEALMKVFVNAAYQESAQLAAEKGSFLLYDEKKIFKNGFLANSGVLTQETLQCIYDNGLRNSQLLTIAPTGTIAIYGGCLSGGGEPLFEHEFIRWAIVNHQRDTLLKNLEYPDWSRGEWKQTKDFKYEMRGDTQVLVSKCGKLMIDQSRGLTKKIELADYGWKQAKRIFEDQKAHDPNFLNRFVELKESGIFATAMELSAEEHVDPFILLSRYIDNSISKTVNLPADYPIEDFDALYRRLWKEGARGLTTYREGTMIAVLETKKKVSEKKKDWKKEQKEFFDIWKSHERGDVVTDDVSLPTEYPMQGFKMESEGRKWYLSVAFKDKQHKRPFAIFVTTNSVETNVVAHGALEALIELAENEGLNPELIDENDRKCAGQNNVNKIARTISLLLRHNVKIEKIVKTLDVLEIPVFSLVYRLKKFLMRWVEEMENGMKCPTCGGVVRLSEGCIGCTECSWTKC